jgi:hypothetical protein
MSKDISRILSEWEFDPDEIRVRIVEGDDGRKKVQMRVDMGVLQMEIDGRPDGERPHDFESWLDYYEDQRRVHDEAHPDSAPYPLDDDSCANLWREGVQFYHRYLSFWHLDRYDLCARDTARNLRLFAFVKTYATNDQAKLQFEQWRPYVTMMHVRAVATPLIEAKRYAQGIRVIDGGIEAIREFLDEYGQAERADECAELVGLERWRDELLADAASATGAEPEIAVQALRKQLEAAVAAEEFEEAARLRDEIRRLAGQGSTP